MTLTDDGVARPAGQVLGGRRRHDNRTPFSSLASLCQHVHPSMALIYTQQMIPELRALSTTYVAWRCLCLDLSFVNAGQDYTSPASSIPLMHLLNTTAINNFELLRNILYSAGDLVLKKEDTKTAWTYPS
jgi:hypothetical protein